MKCVKCGSSNIIKQEYDDDPLDYCDDCGYIQDQKKAEQELKNPVIDDEVGLIKAMNKIAGGRK